MVEAMQRVIDTAIEAEEAVTCLLGDRRVTAKQCEGCIIHGNCPQWYK